MNIRTSAPIFIDLEYPDTRKSINFTFKYNDKFLKQSIIIQNKWTSLRQVIEYIQQTPILKKLVQENKENQLYLYTTDEKLVQSVFELTNEQKLLLKFEPIQLSVDYSKNFEKPKPVIAVKPEAVKDQFALWDKDYVADSEFLNQCFDLKSRYPERVEIGESYPYRLQVYLHSDWSDVKEISAWIYLVDVPGLAPNFTVYSQNPTILKTISKTLKDTLTDASLINDAIEKCFEDFKLIYSKTSTETTTPFLDQDIIDIFPPDFKVAPTMTKANVYYQIYQGICSLSEKSGLPPSICKHLLLNSQGKFLDALLTLKKQFPNVNATTNPKNDIRSYKFDSASIECPICLDDCGPLETIQLGCGHYLCQHCFTQHVVAGVGEGRGNISQITCPTFCCPTTIDPVTIATCINEKQRARFISKLFDEFRMITDSSGCTSCKRVVYSYPNFSKIIPYVPCGCNQILCAFCGQSSFHWPHSCTGSTDILSREAMQDIASLVLVIQTSTICPKCHIAVQKTEGCNHMTCKLCYHQFCYSCGGNYAGHTSCQTDKLMQASRIAVNAFSHLSISDKVLANIAKQKVISSIIQLSESFQKYLEDNPATKELVAPIVNLVKEICGCSVKSHRLAKSHEVSVFIGYLWQALNGKKRTKKLRSSIRQSNETDVLIKTLMCDISLNGYSQVVSQLFVNSSIDLFKSEIIKSLNKKLVQKIELNDNNFEARVKTLRKIRIFNKDGFEILAVYDIPQDGQLFIDLQGETFINPPKDTENPNIIDRQKEIQKLIEQMQISNNKESALEELMDLRTNPIYRETEQTEQTKSNDQAIIEALLQFEEDENEFDFYGSDEECDEVVVCDRYHDLVENN